MDNLKTEIAQTSILSRNKTIGQLGKHLIVLLVSILTSNLVIMGNLAPLSVGITAALPANYFYFAFVGNVLGLIYFGNFGLHPEILIGLCIVLVLKTFIIQILNVKKKVVINTIISFFACIFGLSIFSIFPRLLLISFLTNIGIAVLMSVVTYFLSIGLEVTLLNKQLFHFSKTEKTGIVIAFSLILISICNISIYSLNVGIILGMLSVLVYMNRGGYIGGAISGIIVAISLTLYDKKLAILSGVLIVAGFLAGQFKELGKLPQISIFIATISFGIIIINVDSLSFSFMLNMLISTFCYTLIKEEWINSFCIKETKEKEKDMGMYFGVSSKLEFASNTLIELKQSVLNVLEKINEMEDNNMSSIYYKVADDICKQCALKMNCWTTNYNDTMNVVNKCTIVLKENGEISEDDIPQYFKKKCPKTSEFVKKLNMNYKVFLNKRTEMKKVSESQIVALNQFDGVANMMCEISKELSEVLNFDEKAAIKVRETFEQKGMFPSDVCCIIDKQSRIGIEVYIAGEVSNNMLEITRKISSALERELDLPCISVANNKTKIAFFEKAKYEIEFGAAQMPYENYTLCGDSYDFFKNAKGYAHMILSDGMGSGGRAAIDSSMTCSIILKLLKAGFGFDSTIKLLNNSMLAKATDESLSTIDVSTIDLYEGKLHTIKAGSAPTFLFRKGKVKMIKSTTMPIGIFNDVELDQSEYNLKEDDILVMVSDGITDTGEEFVSAELEHSHKLSSKEIAKKICDQAKKRRIEGKSDDLTVMVAKILKA